MHVCCHLICCVYIKEALRHQLALNYGYERDSEEKLQQIIADKTITANELKDQRMEGPFSFHGYML